MITELNFPAKEFSGYPVSILLLFFVDLFFHGHRFVLGSEL